MLTCDTGRMSEVRVTRAEARLRQIDRIKSTSRRLMAEKGAPGLSLREVAREMGVVSSALYRYFPTRDDLLTALIVDAYNDLGEFAERAALRVPREEPRRRLHAAASAIRKWAKSNPNEYALLYGSPVPATKRRSSRSNRPPESRWFSVQSSPTRGSSPTLRRTTTTSRR